MEKAFNKAFNKSLIKVEQRNDSRSYRSFITLDD